MNPSAQSTQQISKPVQSPSPFPISSPKESHGVMKWILLLAVFIILTIIAGIYEYNYRYNKSSSNDTTAYQAPVKPIPTTDPTSNWRTYTNTAYSYELRYPSDWTYTETSDQSSVQLRPTSEKDMQISAIEVHIGGSQVPPLTTFQDYIKTSAGSEMQGLSSISAMETVVTTSDITGYKTVWQLAAAAPSPNKTLTITYFKLPNGKGTQNVEISLNDATKNDIYMQIIKLFRFTDTRQTLQPISPTAVSSNGYSGVACTQEAKQCADGSYVLRTGPNCAFTACPK